MGKKAEKAIPGDDGRVIAPMNVEGMPWHVRERGRGGLTPGASDGAPDRASGGAAPEPAMLTRREQAAFTWGVLKAALLTALVFIGGLLAFILFCTEVWFR